MEKKALTVVIDITLQLPLMMCQEEKKETEIQ